MQPQDSPFERSVFDSSTFDQPSFAGGNTQEKKSGWYSGVQDYEPGPAMGSPGFVDWIKGVAAGELQKVKDDPLAVAGDVVLSPARGVVDAAMGIYGLADWATADLLPDWETNPLGTSYTIGGSFTQGIANFLTGFIPVVGVLGRAGQVARLGRAGQFIASKSRGASLARNTLASAVADATVFRGDQERLSNLLTQIDNPLFNNAVTQYLAADGDDSEIEGRFKNAIEGLGIGLVVDGLTAGLRAIKKSKAKLDAGGTVEEALSEREKALAGGRILEMAGIVDDAGKGIDDASVQADAIRELEQSLDDGIERTVVSPEDTRTPAQQLDEAFGVNEEDAAGAVDEAIDEEVLVDGEPTKRKVPLNQTDGYPVRKGPQAIINRINREASHGRLDTDEAQFAISFVQRLGNALGRTGIRFRQLEGTTLGRFDFVRDVVTITRRAIQNGSFEHTFVHEIWHSMERYFDEKTIRRMELDLEKARTKEAKNRDAWLKKNPGKNVSDYVKEVDQASYGPTSPFYRLTDVREWAAENLTDATLARLDLEEGTKTVFGFFKFFMKNLLTEIKAKFGVVTYDKIAKDWLAGKGRRMDVKNVPQARPLDPYGLTVAYSKASPTDAKRFDDGSFVNPDARSEKSRLDPKERLGWYDATPEGLARVRKLVEAVDSGSLGRAGLTIEKAIEKLQLNKAWFGKRYLKDGIPDPSDSRDAALVLAEAMDNAYGDSPKPAPVKWDDTLLASLYDIQKSLGLNEVQMAQVVNNLSERQIEIRHFLVAAKEIEHLRANTIAQKARDFEAMMRQADIKDQAGDSAGAAQARQEALAASRELIWAGLGIEKLARANAALSSEVGRTLNILKMTPEGVRKRLGEISEEYIQKGLLTTRLDRLGPDEMMKELERLNLTAEFGPRALREYTEAFKGAGNYYKMANEVWINSILSGLKTFVVNMSSFFNAVTRPTERSLGYLLQGQTKEAKEAFRLAYTWTSKYSEALAFARKAWTDERPILANEAFMDEWVGGAIHSDSGTPLGAAINAFGKLIRTPTRAMLFTDEFFKQATARAKVDEMVQAQALKLVELGALSADEMDRWVRDEVSRMMYDNGRLYSERAVRDAAIMAARDKGLSPKDANFSKVVHDYVQRHFDPSRGRIADEARRYAAEITWQTDLDGPGALEALGRGIQQLNRDLPMLKLVFPFVRTPTNLMIWLKDRSPFGGMKLHRDLMSGDPVRKADAIGRTVVASGLFLTAVTAAGSGVITGRGPKDPRQRRALMDSGWQPYSVKTPNGYVSYHRLEPFSFIFGIIADTYDVMANKYDDAPVDGAAGDKIVAATVAAIANSVTEKSYFAGLSMWVDAFSGDSNDWTRLFRNYAASTVPNFVSSFIPLVDDELKQARTALDAMMAKVPGLSDEVEPYRNVFGEVITKPRSYGLMGALDPANPFTWTESSKDPVRIELAKLKYGFAPPAHTKDGVDLRELRSKSGQSAYDRLQELTGQVRIGGQSLHQSLKKLMGSEAYRRMNDQSFEEIDSPRVQEVKRVVARYRKQAQAQLLREFPEINQAFQLSRENQYRMKLGLSPQS